MMISGQKYLKFAPRIFFKRGLPLQLIFFVTSRCNLRCRHCFYWKKLNHSKKKELTLKEIEKIAKNSRLDLLWLCLTGGEPFLRSDLAEIASAFCRWGKVANISIPTNAQLKGKTLEITQKMLSLCPNTYIALNVSLDGLEKTHDKIRGVKGAFAKTVETFFELKKLKRFSNFGLSLLTTVMAENQKDLKKLYFFARDELQPDYLNLNLIRGNPPDAKMKKVDIRYYEELLTLMETDVKKGKWPYFQFPFSKIALARNFLLYRQVARTFRTKRFSAPCYSSSLSGVMDEEGNLSPCEILKDAKIGNIREVDYDLAKLWFSQRNEAIRKRIAQKCFCTYECAISINTLFNPKFYPAMIKKALGF
jgi:MoaA/NifB/PqqE/SkfB family radical SAM enzyme